MNMQGGRQPFVCWQQQSDWASKAADEQLDTAVAGQHSATMYCSRNMPPAVCSVQPLTASQRLKWNIPKTLRVWQTACLRETSNLRGCATDNAHIQSQSGTHCSMMLQPQQALARGSSIPYHAVPQHAASIVTMLAARCIAKQSVSDP